MVARPVASRRRRWRRPVVVVREAEADRLAARILAIGVCRAFVHAMRGEDHRAGIDQRAGAQADEAVLLVDDHLADAGDVDRIARRGRRVGIGDDDLGRRARWWDVGAVLRREVGGAHVAAILGVALDLAEIDQAVQRGRGCRAVVGDLGRRGSGHERGRHSGDARAKHQAPGARNIHDDKPPKGRNIWTPSSGRIAAR